MEGAASTRAAALARPWRIAIACQGGGSHTAFTAGVLSGILRDHDERELEVVALSGTSGGAICALLAWYGLLQGDPDEGSELLARFWRDNAANAWWDVLLNGWAMNALLLGRYVAVPEVSPYRLEAFRAWVPEPFGCGMDAEGRLRALLEPPEERTAERFTLVVEALEAGNAYLEATTPGGVLRGQVR